MVAGKMELFKVEEDEDRLFELNSPLDFFDSHSESGSRGMENSKGAWNGSESVADSVQQGDEEDAEWFKKRREHVAQASKIARQKKKRELEQVRLENQKLRLERAHFLERIEDLVAKVQEMREGGDIDLHIENELLKAQLEEHKRFVGALRKIATGIPTNEATRRRIYQQGADYATSHVLSLLTRSVKEKAEWKRAILPGMVETFPNSRVAVWYRYVEDFRKNSGNDNTEQPEKTTGRRKRLHVRFDTIFPNVAVEDAVGLYWSLWNDTNVIEKFFKVAKSRYLEDSGGNLGHLIEDECLKDDNGLLSMKQRATKQKQMVTSENVDGGMTPAHNKQKIKISYFKEQMEGKQDSTHFVFVSVMTNRDISKTALHLDMNEQTNNNNKKSSRKNQTKATKRSARGTKASQALDISECAECTVLARSTTTHHKFSTSNNSIEDEDGKGSHDDKHRIKSLYVEGAVCWSCPEENKGKECTRMSVVLSMPEKFEQDWLSGAHDIITEDGCLSTKFAGYMNGFSALLHSQISAKSSAKGLKKQKTKKL